MKQLNLLKPVTLRIAGGNTTAIFCVAGKIGEKKYGAIGRKYIRENPRVEQVGFLENAKHLQMSGGEFCGNASCAAGFLISSLTRTKRGFLTVSGFPGTVRYNVDGDKVRCIFPNFSFKTRRVRWLDTFATIVDMGSIAHVVLPETVPFPNTERLYTKAHRNIVRSFGFKNKKAVGVVWQEKSRNKGLTRINPVVWVKKMNSLFYETSCGSGTLALLISSNKTALRVMQPTGEYIKAERNGTTLSLRSSIKMIS